MQLNIAIVALMTALNADPAALPDIPPLVQVSDDAAALRATFPSADSTGIQKGTNLQKSGSLRIQEDGAIIDSLDIAGTVVVDAPNVTIQNTRIKSESMYGIEGTEKASGLKIINNELDGQGLIKGSYGIGAPNDALITGNKIHGFENGMMAASRNIIKGNYIADLIVNGEDPHYDGIAVQGGQDDVLIEGNTVVSWDTSAIFLKNDFGPINNVRIINNLLMRQTGKNYSYAIYVDGRANGGPITNVTISQNVVEIGAYRAYFSVDKSDPKISGNRDISGRPIGAN